MTRVPFFYRDKPETPSPVSNYPTFRCHRCKQNHEILGSRQRTSKVTGKRIRYCKDCFAAITKEPK